MPLVHPSDYLPPKPLRNGHVQSIYPSLFRKVGGVHYRRTRIPTPDRDFVDLDYSCIGSPRMTIVAHGLEGHSQRSYVLGMVRALNRAGWDAVAWNFRGCSGEPNRRLRFYHSGDSADLETVIRWVLEHGCYSSLGLVGFSMGGNVILKYLGERGRSTSPSISAAVAFSVPCDLASSARQLARKSNTIYMARFLRQLREKIVLKARLFPGQISDKDYSSIKNFRDFDERYTAPLNAFSSAEDYWRRASSKPFLHHISVPTLLVSAVDDPFLASPCYPIQEARSHPFLHLELPAHGGHVGFMDFNHNGLYWSEARTLQFLQSQFPQGSHERIRR